MCKSDLEDLIDDNPVEQEEDNNEQSGDSDENETIGAPRKRNRSKCFLGSEHML